MAKWLKMAIAGHQRDTIPLPMRALSPSEQSCGSATTISLQYVPGFEWNCLQSCSNAILCHFGWGQLRIVLVDTTPRRAAPQHLLWVASNLQCHPCPICLPPPQHSQVQYKGHIPASCTCAVPYAAAKKTRLPSGSYIHTCLCHLQGPQCASPLLGTAQSMCTTPRGLSRLERRRFVSCKHLGQSHHSLPLFFPTKLFRTQPRLG